MNAKHTPTPWTVHVLAEKPYVVADVSIRGAQVIATVGGRTAEEQTANAAFIVRAVNAHNKLVEAAQYATCEKCDHNRCQGLRDALKGLI
jgi:hypothetical protein